ncbi:hypothetical protein Tco_1258069 [Tanacetum coccineum]
MEVENLTRDFRNHKYQKTSHWFKNTICGNMVDRLTKSAHFLPMKERLNGEVGETILEGSSLEAWSASFNYILIKTQLSQFIVLSFSNLRSVRIEPLAIPLEEIQIDDKLHFIEEPVKIMDREVKRLKQSRIPIVKV